MFVYREQVWPHVCRYAMNLVHTQALYRVECVSLGILGVELLNTFCLPYHKWINNSRPETNSN